MSGSVRLFATFLASAAICLAVASCQTGVDSTGRIELSRKERRLFRATEADTLLNAAAANDSLPAWKPGRPFLAVSDRTAYIFESASLGTADPISLHLGGKILTFGGMETKTAPDGTPHATIIFNDGDTRYVYDTGRTPAEARSLQPDRMPLLVDLTIVARADSILRGRKLWTLNPNRYTTDGVLLNESKFMPVTVDSVVAGNDGLPFKICFATPSGPRYVLAGLDRKSVV